MVSFCKKGLDKHPCIWYIYYVDSCMKTYGDKEMFRSMLIVSAVLIALTGCQTTNRTTGALVGGLAGGLLGNTIGKGSGNKVSTAAGAIIGTIVGSQMGGNMDRQHQHNAPMTYGGYSACAKYGNSGARAACNRGVAQRNAQRQRNLENQAYQDGMAQ